MRDEEKNQLLRDILKYPITFNIEWVQEHIFGITEITKEQLSQTLKPFKYGR